MNALIGTIDHSIIAGTSTGVYRSVDHGKIWTKVSNTPATFLHQLPNGTMFGYRTFSGSGIFRSVDSGKSWIELKNGMGNTIIHSMAFSKSGDLYAGSDAGLFRSIDAGDNWTRIDTQKVNKPNGVFVAVNADGKLFFGGAKSGVNSTVSQSTDGGISWSVLDNSISSTDHQATIRSLFAASNGRLFAGTSAGLFRSMSITTSVKDRKVTSPGSFELFQNYPNPFNPETSILFSVMNNGFTRLDVYSIIGEKVAVLVNEELTAGTYQTTFNGADVSSGIYFYRLSQGGRSKIGKMILVK